MSGVARKDDTSDHGGYIMTAASTSTVDGKLIARVGDLHSCPIPGHGITTITKGSGKFTCEGAVVAVIGSTCGCGALINSGSTTMFAPLDP